MMRMKLLYLFVTIAIGVTDGAQKTASEYPGFNTWLTDNVVEVLEPTMMKWENGGMNIPSWLTGTYMKNGPARSKFGEDGQEYMNVVDGWAKINKFTIQHDGEQPVLMYSSGFVNSPLYQDFMDHKRMTPHTVLGEVTQEFECPDLKTFVDGAQIENDNVTIEKMKVKGEAAMIVSTDSARVNQFDQTSFTYRQTIQTAPQMTRDFVITRLGTPQSHRADLETETMEDMLGINEAEFVAMMSKEIDVNDIVKMLLKGAVVHPENEIMYESENLQADANSTESDELSKIMSQVLSFIWKEVLSKLFRLLWDKIQSRLPRGTFASCAHWKRRPGQPENFLNYGMSGVMMQPKLSLYQFRDGVLNDPSHRELLGEAMIPLKSLIHEFSVTPNYAIFFCYPVILDFTKIDLKSAALAILNHEESWAELRAAAKDTIAPNFLVPFLEWSLDRLEPVVRAKIDKLQPSKRYPLQNLLSHMNTTAADTTEVVVFDLNQRKEVMRSSVETFYGTHHVNAYEASDGTLVCDVVRAPNDALKKFTDKTFLHSHPVNETKFSTPLEVQRYTLDLATQKIKKESWDEVFGMPVATRRFIHQFDFPNIHPGKAGYEYQYAYGQAMIDFQRHYLVKKDLENGQDKVWPNSNSTNCQYSGEPFFVPNPEEGAGEDDGVVFSVVLDGLRPNPNPDISSQGESYLLILDARTFEELDRAYLNCHIPMSIHGNWFDEIL